MFEFCITALYPYLMFEYCTTALFQYLQLGWVLYQSFIPIHNVCIIYHSFIAILSLKEYFIKTIHTYSLFEYFILALCKYSLKAWCFLEQGTLSSSLSRYWPRGYKTQVHSQTQNSAMIGCLRTRVRRQPIIALYFESETVITHITILRCPHNVDYDVSKLLKQNKYSLFECFITVFSGSDIVTIMCFLLLSPL